MEKKLFIYENANPVTVASHGDWSIKVGNGYKFAADVNSLPLMAIEFPKATVDFPIVFAGTEGSVMPVVVMGLRDQENLFVSDEGLMDASYVPAFLRRYPFVFSASADGKTFTLCLDEAFEGCNAEGVGEKLFDAEGTRTQYVENVLNFLQDYQAQFQRTQAFCKKLVELELLEPMGAQFTVETGEKLTLSGFQAISRTKLKTLSAEQLHMLAATDELELIYLHLQSMHNFNSMVKKLAPKLVVDNDDEKVA
jgi:hypothetical protein